MVSRQHKNARRLLATASHPCSPRLAPRRALTRPSKRRPIPKLQLIFDLRSAFRSPQAGSEPDARLESAPGPPWSAVEYASTHPHDVRLRPTRHVGNEIISQCGRATTKS